MIQRAIEATNASKAVVSILLNAMIAFSGEFGIYEFSDGQQQALAGLVNATLLVYVLLTYKFSHKRDGRADALRV